MHILNIQFEPRYFWQSSDFAASDCLQTFLQRSFRNENRLTGDNELCKAIAPLILKADREFTEKSFGWEQLLKATVLEILIILSRAEKSLPKTVHDTEQAARIGYSMDYIAENITSELTLESIAREAKMSRTYYSAVFKKLNGVSPWEYICIKRIEIAMSLLRKSDENILDIALLSGFNNTANFNKIFKRITGITPKEYRCYNN